MARRFRKRKCKHCHVFFPPDPRNAWHQEYCYKPECRKASKAESRRRWLQKPENVNHFRWRENVLRVQEWRKANPGYWRRKTSLNGDALGKRQKIMLQQLVRICYKTVHEKRTYSRGKKHHSDRRRVIEGCCPAALYGFGRGANGPRWTMVRGAKVGLESGLDPQRSP